MIAHFGVSRPRLYPRNHRPTLSVDIPNPTPTTFHTISRTSGIKETRTNPTTPNQNKALSGADTLELGALHPVRDLNYVKETVVGFLAVARSDESTGTVSNIGRGEGITIGELAETLLELCDSDAKIRSVTERERPEKSEVQALVCDNTKAGETLNWQPRFTLREGLQETVAWMRHTLDHYKAGLYNV